MGSQVTRRDAAAYIESWPKNLKWKMYWTESAEQIIHGNAPWPSREHWRRIQAIYTMSQRAEG
jgi:hypothetical protein